MILAAAFALGFALGWIRAARRGGRRADQVQYGLAHGFGALVLTAAGALALGFAGGPG